MLLLVSLSRERAAKYIINNNIYMYTDLFSVEAASSSSARKNEWSRDSERSLE